ncbi:DNA polymerase III subunit beta [Salmonella enterica subsp. enterica]|uniref:DNA polymerase III subunit beta n=1 Tax=Salmonella enterica I TaxID=59201 RepID=A0A447TRX7_SALET|nr:DNA polymerase III subunit beta [Salmonella enterica subsp. enterica]
MEIGFNVSYVLDVLNALKWRNRAHYADGFRIQRNRLKMRASQSAAYVVMPMRL